MNFGLSLYIHLYFRYAAGKALASLPICLGLLNFSFLSISVNFCLCAQNKHLNETVLENSQHMFGLRNKKDNF